MKHVRRFLSAALALVMALGVFPTAALPALAAGDLSELEGKTFAIVNPGQKMAMTAEATDGHVSLQSVAVSGVGEKSGVWTAECESQSTADQIKVWTLEAAKEGENKYYITTGSGGNKRYLQMVGTNKAGGYVGGLQLVDKKEASPFEVRTNDQGYYCFTASVTINDQPNCPVSISSDKGNHRFGGWQPDKGPDQTNWQALCPVVAAPEPPEPAQGVSPAGTTIDLFDYWVKGTSEEENADGNTIPLYNKGYIPKLDASGNQVKDENGEVINELNSSVLDPTVYSGGINANHALKFTSAGDSGFDGQGKIRHINEWSGSAAVTENIVYRLLNDQGYPTVRAGQVIDEGEYQNKQSTTPATKLADNEPLDYLFDPDQKNVMGREAYPNVMGLLQVDQAGYFHFDSAKTSAQLNKDGKTVTIYNLKEDDSCVGFFPFNEATDTGKGYAGITNYGDQKLNHFFGVHMSTQFIQPRGGKTDEGADITYDFTGDDDVWIFLDGVLVGDVGGNHDAATLNINFATGDVVVNRGKNGIERASTILDQYILAALEDQNRGSVKIDGIVVTGLTETTYQTALNDAEKVEVTIDGTVQRFKKNEKEIGWIYEDDSYHTLDFFYLERGGYASNLKLKYNLQEIAPTYVKKVDQDGNGIEGVRFDLRVVKPQDNNYATWTSGEPTTPVDNKIVASGTTDANGILTLRYSQEMGSRAGKLMSLADLFTQYRDHCVGEVVSSGDLHYRNALLLELKEQAVSGTESVYRTLETISLRLECINDTYILRSNDRWNNGVYATPNVIVSAPQEIQFMAKAGETSSKDKVNLKDRQDWLDNEGKTEVGLFAVVLGWLGDTPPEEEKDIASMRNWGLVHGSAEEGWTITPVLKDEDSENDFSKKLGKLIGELSKQSRDASLDGIAYRFSPGASGGYETTIPNLPGEIDSYYFMVADNHGELSTNPTEQKDQLKRVKFATGFYYSEAETWEDMDGSQTWRVNHRDSGFKRNFGATVNVPNIQDRLLVQRLDEVGNTLTGAKFALYDERAVDDATGELMLKPDARPLETKTTADLTKKEDGVTINGGALFDSDGAGLANGVYYLVEEAPPPGYAPNKEIVKVIVDAQGVHAYAGEPAEDGSIDPSKGIAYGDHDGVSVLVGVGRLVDTMASFGSVGQINKTLTDIYVLRARAKAADGTDAERDAEELSWYEIEIEDQERETVRRQRKWRRYDSNAALEYAYVEDETDTLGLPNPLKNEENPSGYLSSSGWNWLLVSQNYWGIYDQGRSYQQIKLEEEYPERVGAVNTEISKKTPLPHKPPSTDDNWAKNAIWSDGYTTYGNKILNRLFSGSTTVRFASASRTSLSVTKVVEANGGTLTGDEQFSFDLSFTYTATPLASNRDSKVVGDIDLDKPALAGKYPYQVTKDEDVIETGTLEIDEDGEIIKVTVDPPVSAALTDPTGAGAPVGEGCFRGDKLWLADHETLTIENLPAGTAYTVAEDSVTQYETAVAGTSTTGSAPTLDQSGRTATNTLSAAGQSDAVTFTNTYQPGSAVIKGTKILEGREWGTGETFTFTLTGTNNGVTISETQTATSADKGFSFTLDNLTAGTYTYTLQEDIPEGEDQAPAMTYDTSVYEITVTVAGDGSAKVSYAKQSDKDWKGSEAVFTNTYTPEPATLPLTVSKTWEADPRARLRDGYAATFKLEADQGNPSGATLPTNADSLAINGENGTASFDPIAFTQAGTYTFTVSEVAGTTQGVTYDDTVYTVTVKVTDDGGQLTAAAEYLADGKKYSYEERTGLTFTNTYATDKATITGRKVLEGRAWADNETFTFTLTKEDGTEVQSADASKATPMFSFDVEGLEVDDHIFLLREKIPAGANESNGYTLDGLTYDTSVYRVTVTVTDGGTEVSYAKQGDEDWEGSEAVFTNTYTPEPATLALTVSKTWEGEPFPDGFVKTAKFQIAQADTDAHQVTVPGDIEITGDETGSFDDITFTQAGTYKFTVSEIKGDTTGVTYDDTKYTVTVTVTESETDPAKLAIGTVTYTDASGNPATSLTFTNTYTPPDEPDPTPVKLALEVSKTWTGDNFPDGFVKTAEFQIAQADLSAHRVTVPGAIEITGNGTGSFDDIIFTQAGEYTFKVSEVAGTTQGVTYDGTVYTVTVEVTEGETDPAKLAIGTVTYSDAGGKTAASLSFTNKYTPPDEPDPGPDDPELHPDISVTKELIEVNGRPYRGGPVEEDDDLTYEITVKNTGDVPLFDVDLRDFAPDELIPDGEDRWYWDELDVGETVTVEFYAWVDRGAEGRLTNRVEVTGETEDGKTVDDQDRETVKVEEPYDPPTPPRPPVEPDEPDDPVTPPEDLNTEDHVAYIIGYPDGTVRPDGPITRAEATTIFFRLLTDEAREKYWCQVNGYTDVPYESWFNNAISTLSNMGIVSGYPDGSFRPDAPITRAELTKIAVGFFQYADQYFTYLGNFTDVTGNEWFASFVAAASALGLIEGYPDGSFRPDAAITRAETCTIINRTLGRRPHKDHLLPWAEMITWPDNQMTEAWYYPQIQEATNSHDYRWTSFMERFETVEAEQWTEKLPERDWAALEQVWSTAHSAPGGEVMG